MTADQARTVVDVLTGSIENESKATRKVIAAIPNSNRDYKPDPKSRSAWEIAVHLVLNDIWFADSILSGAFVWAGEPPTPKEMTDPAAVARWHEQHLGERLAKLRAMTPDQMVRIVDAFGMSAPAASWLTMMNNHAIHHRGQLAAYLRPAGSKVPAIYGVSADESAFA
ncbi:MAG: DinB family protein [Vicinamibacterales bacterium]